AVTGIKWDSYGYTDITLIKTNPVGDSLWGHSWGGADDDASTCVQQTTDGGYIISAETRSFGEARVNAWLLKTDVNGDTTWARILGAGWGHSVQQTTDGGYIICGGLTLIKTDSLGYVGVEEPITKPALTDWRVVSPVGSTVTLKYSNRPQGFHAFVFDASGRKVDEMRSQGESGTITWGQGVSAGVYFVRVESSHPATKKIILIK
ncbi:T9SS type A sorting domain-containing protein, partial [bacterium]|nr:T9SS type A sorting domain-containing protein [bacterium]